MNEFGSFAVSLAWFLSVLGFIAGAWSGITRSAAWRDTAVRATLFTGVTTMLSLIALGVMFFNSDFSNQYVWQFSNRDMPWIYRITAIWGGMDGSMLLWAAMLTTSGAVLAWKVRGSLNALIPWTLAAFNTCAVFFLTVVVYLTNPFRFIKANFIPPDGNGLNPLLQNPYMAVHPPLLYLGFTTFAVPFSFCVGALISGSLSNEWLRLTRRWTLIAWGFLTAGIVMGGHWAYLELGWGGFWAWDPVENASFLPWLTGTAYLHSVMVQERKNMLRFWNVWLIVLTYGLTVFGTFLTRSGVVQSVHAFASTDVGWVFLLYLAIVFCTAVVLTWLRRDQLRSERKIESFLSREAFFLLNNLALLSICFATLWGVMFPVLSEAIVGRKQTVSIPFFNAVNVPFFLTLIFLMGIGPLIAWRKASFAGIRRTFLTPFISGLALSSLLAWAGITSFYALLSYGLSFFVLMTIFGELHRGIAVQRATVRQSVANSAITLTHRHLTRYGGYLVHFGVLMVTIAVTASMAHKTEREFSLAMGESYQVGRFSLTLTGLEDAGKPRWYEGARAIVSVKRTVDGADLGVLAPELRRYFKNDESTTEVALRMGPREDLYLVLAGLDQGSARAALKVFINPLQVWLWIGALVMVAGTVVVLIPRRQEVDLRAPTGAVERV